MQPPFRSRLAVIAFIADLAALLVFVLIGRASHDENPVTGALVTLWPFAAGLIIGWAIVCLPLIRGWRTPTALAPTGLIVWVLTVVGGLVLRAVSGQGVQPSFAIVTAIVLAVFMLGWRGLVRITAARRRVSSARRVSSGN